ncbi:hypothetical protein [Desulfogranum japonicum]|nr:hypothetical protein [Desulfogranum japonicum]
MSISYETEKAVSLAADTLSKWGKWSYKAIRCRDGQHRIDLVQGELK